MPQVDVREATNVLDRWISAASRSLTAFLRREMGAYRLYTVVPFLVRCFPLREHVIAIRLAR